MVLALRLLQLAAALGAASATDWKARRGELVAHLFGGSGALPTRHTPDFGPTKVAPPQASGCLSSARGHNNASACAWDNQMQTLGWTIGAKLPAKVKDQPGITNNASGSYIVRNSTVFYTLNTSGSAPGRHGWSVEMPTPPIHPTGPSQNAGAPAGSVRAAAAARAAAHAAAAARAEPLSLSLHQGPTLVIFHQGHDIPHNVCQPDNNGEIEWLNTLGYDVMGLEMPQYIRIPAVHVNSLTHPRCSSCSASGWAATGKRACRRRTTRGSSSGRRRCR